MAVFVFAIALKTFGDLLTFGSALWSVGVCGGSWSECRSRILARRKERLFEELLERCYRENENMSSESIDSCDFAYPEGTASPGSVSLDKSSATDVIYREDSITEVSPGLCFVVAGTVLLTCERFSVNLMLKNDDIALHVNPRLPQNYIVRNCRVKRCWGREEVASPLAFNLHRGHRFNVQILVTDDEFLICVNGRHCNTFKHRLPYRKICALEVRGDVRDVAVEQCYMECYPQLELELIQQRSPEEQCAIADERLACHEKSCKPMPYTGVLREPFTDGKKLHIYGRVKLLPHSFYVNLQTSGYVWPHPNILFHLNPRFGSVGGRHVICRNSWRNGKWEREERSENMSDFMPGKPFHLQIDCTDGSYQVSLNGNLKAEFLHRDNPRLAEAVYIQGDIKVYDVVVEKAY
ncbi:32 kDa beta-galactoside-binding lectin-like [Anopheles bellator]|uniref:32 kDa beta-galactoside-binding lectin-like n=1 Tax=Anopheles bellator TaxID=139047 RepID=UPI00264852E0|nr:32 kDa beta-galactoside-binding lectin-like [Anopheles bellator]